MGTKVWAEALDIPGHICSDARLRGGNVTSVSYPSGKSYGQAGWEIGIVFKSLADLAKQLYDKPVSSIKRGQIDRLGIHLHGLPGQLFFEGQDRKKRALKVQNIRQYHKDLHKIGLSTSPNATILLVGCLAGAGWDGKVLLENLSKIWVGRKVVAFTTIGFVSGGDQLRPGSGGCTEPGMRDTKNTSPMLGWAEQQKAIGPLWKDLNRLPWASEKSPHAKVAINGSIVLSPKNEVVTPPKIKNYKPGWLDNELWQLYKALKMLSKSPRPDKRKIAESQGRFLRLIREREVKGLFYKFPGNKGYLDLK